VIGPNVRIGAGTRIDAHAVIERDTHLGSDCRVHSGAVLGGDPQDLKYGGEAALLVVGDRTVIRECATLNRGTAARGRTQIGADCLLMAYSHVAHDCFLGDHVILANSVNMGGHCDLGDWVIIGGMTPIHQFVKVGAHAFVGGSSAVRKDVPPFVKASGDPLRLFGLNSVGLQRRGFTDADRQALRRAYRLLFRSKQNLGEAIAPCAPSCPACPRGDSAGVHREQRTRRDRMTDTLRIGVVGVGSLGFHHARILSGMPDVTFGGMYDSSAVRAAEVSAQLNVRAARAWRSCWMVWTPWS
jgi:UDP-N-acetylglucosamine acyltransferase